MAEEGAGDRVWRKVLYERQNYPDNYVDASFLQHLKRNVNFRHVSRTEAIAGACRVTQQICMVCLFGVTFVHMDEAIVNPMQILTATSLATLFGYIIYKFLVPWDRSFSDDAKSVAIFLSCGYGLSPVLKTLTASISTDTIQATSSLMFLAHLVFHNYGMDAAIVSGAMSVNAAMFASICLASRLPSNTHVFVLLTMAVEIFALWPILREKVLDKIPNSHQIAGTVVLVSCTCVSIAILSVTLAVLFLILAVFISIVCPLWFVSWQTLKENIYGPWDEAIIKDL